MKCTVKEKSYPSTKEAEEEGPRIPGQCELQNKTSSWTNKQEKRMEKSLSDSGCSQLSRSPSGVVGAGLGWRGGSCCHGPYFCSLG